MLHRKLDYGKDLASLLGYTLSFVLKEASCCFCVSLYRVHVVRKWYLFNSPMTDACKQPCVLSLEVHPPPVSLTYMLTGAL